MQYLRMSGGTAKYLFCQAFSRDSAPPFVELDKIYIFIQTYCFSSKICCKFVKVEVNIHIEVKMTGGTPEVRCDKSLTLLTFNI